MTADRCSPAAAATPPGPAAYPVVGVLPSYSPDPLAFLPRCVREYGDVVHLRFPGPSAYLLGDPALVEEVLVDRGENFIKARVTRQQLAVLGEGLLLSEGEFWRRQRRLVQPAFHRGRVRGYADVMVSYTERMLKGWRPGVPRDLHRDMMGLTLEVVAKTLFDEDLGGSPAAAGDGPGPEIEEALGQIMAYFSDQGVPAALLRMLPGWLPAPSNLRYRRARRRLDAVIHRLIRERRRRDGDGDGRVEDRGDLLGMLMSARDENGEGMGDGQLRDEVMTVILAGHETTALALSWAFWLLGKHPGHRERLEGELDRVLDGRPPGPGDLPQLPFLDAVLKETMRLYPPAWALGREAASDCEIGGHPVPAGTQIFISQWVLHRDGRRFDRPEEFVPERWLDGSTDGLPRYAYFPFGGGPRVCAGVSFAKMEAALLLATITRGWRLEPVPGRDPAPEPSITLRPAGGVWVIPARRS